MGNRVGMLRGSPTILELKPREVLLQSFESLHEIETTDLPGAKHGGEKDVGLPLLAAEALVDPGRDVSGRSAEADEQDHGAGHQSSSVGRRKESEASEDLEARKQHLSLKSGQGSKYMKPNGMAGIVSTIRWKKQLIFRTIFNWPSMKFYLVKTWNFNILI